MSTEQELQVLKAQGEALKRQLDQVARRIEKLEKQE